MNNCLIHVLMFIKILLKVFFFFLLVIINPNIFLHLFFEELLLGRNCIHGPVSMWNNIKYLDINKVKQYEHNFFLLFYSERKCELKCQSNNKSLIIHDWLGKKSTHTCSWNINKSHLQIPKIALYYLIININLIF